MPILIEACIDSVESAVAAERGGADRVELCDALFDGGTTPSAGMIAAVKAAIAIPVFVIVRPRGGGFVHSAAEADVMLRDIDAARRLGADGLVIGALRPDGAVDEVLTRLLVDAADGLPVTFHRAFDLVRDATHALDAIASCGVRRVLTSGGAPTALEGAESIAGLVHHAAGRGGGRLTIVAGGGIREPHVAELVRTTGVREIHVRGTRLTHTMMRGTNERVRLRKALPEDEGAWEVTDEARIRDFAARVSEGH